MTIEGDYQTIPLADGSWSHGLFPTDEWFERIATHVDFRGKTVVDLGCCQFSYGIQALNKDAKYVYGIDNSKQRCEQSKKLIESWGYNLRADVDSYDVQHWYPDGTWEMADKYDIAIMSMIVHWLSEPEEFVKKVSRISKTMVFVYRYPQAKEETGWRPTLEQLDKIVGYPHKHAEKISDTEAQNIMLAIYERPDDRA